MTAIIVSAIHFVNWSISTQTTCSRFESIEGRPLDTDRAIVYTYRSTIEREYQRSMENAQRALTLMANRCPQTTNFPASIATIAISFNLLLSRIAISHAL